MSIVDDIFFASLSVCGKYFCKACAEDVKLPLLWINRNSLKEENNSRIFIFRAEGLTMTYPENFESPFYGYKCSECQEEKPKRCFKCTSCQEIQKVWCEKCVEQRNECSKKGHAIVLEKIPFSFWCDKMSEKELKALEYKNEPLSYANEDIRQAEIFFSNKDYTNAISYYKKFIEKHSSNLESRVEVATSYNNLGNAYLELGLYDMSYKSHEKALEIRTALNLKEPTALSFCNLGVLLQRTGKYDAALKFQMVSLQIYEEVYGEKDETIVRGNLNVADILCLLRNFKDALKFAERSLMIGLSLYGQDHPKTAKSYISMGRINSDMGDNEEALKYFQKALQIQLEILGEKHPDTGSSYEYVGNVSRLLDQKEIALDHYLKALKIKEQTLGENHINTANTYFNIAEVYASLQPPAYEKAEEYHFKALKIRQEAYKGPHPTIGESQMCLATIWMKVGYYSQALECFTKAHKIFQLTVGPNHPYVQHVENLLQKTIHLSSLDKTQDVSFYHLFSLKFISRLSIQFHLNKCKCKLTIET